MSLDDYKNKLSTAFDTPNEAPTKQGLDVYDVELQFTESWELYNWRAKAYRAAETLDMPIKMRTEDGAMLKVSTLQEDGFERLVEALGGREVAPTVISKTQNTEVATAEEVPEGFDYAELRASVNKLIPL